MATRMRACCFGLACAWLPCAQLHAQDSAFGADKALHFSACALISVASYTVAASLDADEPVRFAAAFGVPLAAGVAKELIDAARGHDASRGDLAWDILGTAAGVGVSWLFGEVLFPRPASQAHARSPDASEHEPRRAW